MANNAYNTDLFDRAAKFAIDAHHGTERRGKAFPYIIHPMEAAEIVASITNDQELLAAAILHDVCEDTDVTEEDIRREFGDRIADIVASESIYVDESRPEVDTWVERKQLSIDRVKNASYDAKIVALADKLSNMRAMVRDYEEIGDKLWDRFHAPDPSLHAWHYRGLLEALSDLEDTDAYQEFKALVEKIF